MKPLLEDIGKKRGIQSFLAFAINQNRFDFFWHYHPEYELTLIVKGKGRRLIGDNHEYFESGDLVLIGPGLPHTWVSDSSMKGKSETVVIQFSVEFIERFAGLDELSAINKLLLYAKQGIAFKGKYSAAVKELIKHLPEKRGVEKITGLMYILNELSKLRSVPLSIQKAAVLINLSPSAFCKFFKRMTGKTFSDYVNDIRITNVCSQLLASDRQIAEIAYGNGFETLTYFNRIFMKKINMRPSSYRKM